MGVEVALGRRDLRVAEQCLHGRGVEAADRERREGVAQVMEGQRGKAGGISSGVVPATKRTSNPSRVATLNRPVTWPASGMTSSGDIERSPAWR